VAQTFGRSAKLDDVDVDGYRILIPSLGLALSFEVDASKSGGPFLVVRTTDGSDLEIRPVAINTIGVRRIRHDLDPESDV